MDVDGSGRMPPTYPTPTPRIVIGAQPPNPYPSYRIPLPRIIGAQPPHPPRYVHHVAPVRPRTSLVQAVHGPRAPALVDQYLASDARPCPPWCPASLVGQRSSLVLRAASEFVSPYRNR